MFKYEIIDKDDIPVYAFKIHISATIENYQSIYKLVIPFLKKMAISYKYINKDEDVFHNFSVYESPAESGKFITIYPRNHQEFLDILDNLYDIIPLESKGIYILSDRPYKDSNNIFYRYGFLKEDLKYMQNGVPTLKGPNGEIWQDYQKAYYDLPSWVEDIQEESLVEDSYLSEHYKIHEVVNQCNGGNVYVGECLENQDKVILKESRPDIVSFKSYTKRSLREHEYEISQKLDKYIPKSYELVSEWINMYYIYQFIEGDNLIDYSKKYSIISYKGNFQKENVKKFISFVEVVKQILGLVQYFHGNNIILNDIHGENFIMTAKGELYFIDLENSYEENKGTPFGLYSFISLKEWNKLDGKVADCHKVGNLILSLFAKLQIKKENQLEEACNMFVDFLRRYGISSNITTLIKYLFMDNASITKALEIARGIKVDIYTKKVSFGNVNITDCELQCQIENMIAEKTTHFNKYLENKQDEAFLKFLISREKNLGLEGLSGKLILMKQQHFNESILSYGVNFILSKLVDTSNGKMIPLDMRCASPYLNNGTAGFIRALIYLDKEAYYNIILQIAPSLLTEFAQYSGYWDGLLGIADTLLEIYMLNRDREYLETVYQMLVTSSVYAKCNRVSPTELSYVFSRYKCLKIQK